MTRRLSTLAVLLALGGCATRADLVNQDRQLRSMIQEQRRQLQSVQKELERLRGDVEEGTGGRTGAKSGGDDRVAELERRLAELEGHGGEAATRTGETTAPPPGSPPPPASPPAATTATREKEAAPAAPAAAAGGEDDAWRKDVAREQAAAGSVNVPERAEYLGLLDGVARGDCAKEIPALNGFASAHKDSPLADNALYWAGRCYAQRGKQEDAVSKFYEVVTRYPKGDKAAAALWAQGNLFVGMGNNPDARIVFSKLTRDYPNSEEAARARQKLSELEN